MQSTDIDHLKKEKNPMNVSIGAEKAVNKIHCWFMLDALSTLETERNFFGLIRNMCQKPEIQ